ncbi:unnamed protein product [Mytilus edulis]|uniref:Uncharacterized protein n=1 Tax=Mytilus edulis TaxID=6550 RepID=A0A8S3TL63_MYTED|nr:unnamed protein product [Mytilus edulis]
MNDTHQKIKELAANGSSTEELWLIFKTNLNQSVTNHIPHKMAKQKDSLPWLTPSVRKLIKRRDRLYKKHKKSAVPSIKSKLKETKRMVQRELRRSYWNYIENIVTPKEENNQYSSMKRFWTYIKHQKTESNGVAPLRTEAQLPSTTSLREIFILPSTTTSNNQSERNLHSPSTTTFNNQSERNLHSPQHNYLQQPVGEKYSFSPAQLPPTTSLREIFILPAQLPPTTSLREIFILPSTTTSNNQSERNLHSPQHNYLQQNLNMQLVNIQGQITEQRLRTIGKI